jgi:2-dehydropantoate 2-reductase
MRYIIYGAGAVGSVIGGRLVQADHDVILIARGEHLMKIQARGLTLKTPDSTYEIPIRAVGHPSEIEFSDDDVVLFAMQSQDSEDAQRTLFSLTGHEMPVVCAQNGVVNERLAARRFKHVYGMIVRLPCSILEPGIVTNETSPGAGVLDVGCYPTGSDDFASQMAADFESGGFSSRVDPIVMRWKYAKLLFNLKNVYPAIFQPGEDLEDVAKIVREEALACYQAAGIEFASPEEMRERSLPYFKRTDIPGIQRPGSSTWQSLSRGRTRVETDYLNGEIVLLGALHGVPTPYNRAMQIMANEVANGRIPLQGMKRQDLEKYL